MKNILNKFKVVLGQYCANNQFVELSIRCILTEHTHELENKPEFIELASKYALTLTSFDIKQLVNSVSRNYIINIHACFEVFLLDLIDQIKRFGCTVLKGKEDRDSLLKYVVNYIYPSGIPKELKSHIDVCEYYRLVRNDSVHDIDGQTITSSALKKVLSHPLDHDAKFNKLKAPNASSQLTFDDFVMFARSAQTLACALYSSFAYDYNKILLSLDDHTKSKIGRLKGDLDRGVNYLYALICTGFKDSPTLKDDIRIFLMNL